MTRLQLLVGIGGKKPPGNSFYRNPQLFVQRTAADGIRTAQFRSVYLGADRDVLPLVITERFPQLWRARKSYGYTIRRFPAYIFNR